MKVVSLLPSATEVVFLLGRGADLAGVTFECDFPLEARDRRVISSSGLDDLGDDPEAIDAAVRATTEEGRPLYRLDEAAIAEIDPDVILTQDLCRVCAVPSGDVDEALGRLGCRAEVVSLDPQDLDEVITDIERVGAVLGVADAAGDVVDGLRRRLAAVASAVAGRARPRVVLLEWVDPPFGAGHWIPGMVETAGGEAVLGWPGRPSGPLDWPQVTAARPDMVIVAPCGFGLDGAVDHARQAMAHLPSGVAVWAMDGDAHVVRPGPRLVDGVEVLAGILHPDAWPRPGPAEATLVPWA